jgi:hypothetical protein
MKNDKILLLELKERTSASGNTYLSGWLGKASVVGFLDRESDEKVWQVYVSTPKQRDDQSSQRRTGGQGWRRDITPRSSSHPVNQRPFAPGELDDNVSDIGLRG